MQIRIAKRSLLLSLLLLLSVPCAFAEQDPGARITSFYSSLLDVMKNAKTLGFAGRATTLGPVIDDTFDIPAMTRFAVGPDWATLKPAEQAGLTSAFRRMTDANYAHNFDGYSGEKFVVDPKVQIRGPDAIVQSELQPTSGAPTKLAYRMRKSGANWKVIDVYYLGSVSELTTRRAEFGSILKAQGAKGLETHINKLADSLSK